MTVAQLNRNNDAVKCNCVCVCVNQTKTNQLVLHRQFRGLNRLHSIVYYSVGKNVICLVFAPCCFLTEPNSMWLNDISHLPKTH